MHETADSLELARRASALEALLVRVQGRLLDRVRLLMGHRARRLAESGDFVQGVVLEALESFHRGSGPKSEASFLRWLTAIARNNIHDAVRRDRERAMEALSSTVFGRAGDGIIPGPSRQHDIAEDVHRLLEFLERLDDDHRLVIELRALERLPVRQVALQMRRSEGAVHMLYRRAVLRLGALLGKPEQ